MIPLPRMFRKPTPVLPPAGPGRRVLVTGGASGLGLDLATLLLARGDRVVIADLAPTDARPDSIPSGADYLRLDVRSEAEWSGVRDEVARRYGGLDVLVNNAGIAQGGRIEHVTEDDWNHILDVNLHGVARGCRVFVPMLKEQGAGYLLNVASLAGIAHSPSMSSYTATKAGVLAMSESIRWELEPFGVGVSVLCPSFFKTNLASSLNTSDPRIAAVADKLINKSDTRSTDIARAAVDGMDAGTFLLLPNSEARTTRLAKHLAPWVYEGRMREMAARFVKVTGERSDSA